MHERVIAELRAGRKTGHWMWFVFPQVAGLGRSELSRFYAIDSLDEARAYLAHPVLGPRLRECARGRRRLAGLVGGGDLRRHRRREAPLVDDAVPARRTGRDRLRPGA